MAPPLPLSRNHPFLIKFRIIVTSSLTSRFGDGYTVILRVSGDQPDVTSVERFFSETFSDYELREKHHNMLQYQIGAHLLAKTFTSGVLPRVIVYFRF